MNLRLLAASYVPSLLSHLWSSTLFLLLVLLTVFLMRRRLTASARFSLAMIGILKFAIPGAIVRRIAGDLFPNIPSRAILVPLQVLGGSLPFQPTPAPPSVWPAIAVAVWIVIALTLILRFALTRHHLLSISIRTAAPATNREVEALTRARKRLGIRGAIDIARSAAPEAPALLRIVRPLVVLPSAGCDDLSDDELESLLCHECAHAVRNDNLIARIESVICALFWFHPLIWIAQRITLIERERACDEMVAASADQRDTYLAALTKFCHAAIAPRLPGVSCMATAKLKERMEYVMNYPALKAQAPPSGRVAFMATAAMILFTIASGIAGNQRAFAETQKANEPYAIRISATRAGDSINVHGSVSDNKTQRVVASSKVVLDSSRRGTMKTSGDNIDVGFEFLPDRGDGLVVEVTIAKEGKIVQNDTFQVAPSAGETAKAGGYTGAPISLSLKDAELRDVISIFGKLTGLEMRMETPIEGKVTVQWHNVPWDQAFESLVKDNGLTYKIEGKTVFISKQ